MDKCSDVDSPLPPLLCGVESSPSSAEIYSSSFLTRTKPGIGQSSTNTVSSSSPPSISSNEGLLAGDFDANESIVISEDVTRVDGGKFDVNEIDCYT